MNAKKILVVDDEPLIREMLARAFNRGGYTVGSAASGEEALKILAHEYFPVMFIDLGLGLDTMSGFDLCEQIRQNHPKAIIYAVTGYARLFGPKEILAAGFGWYGYEAEMEIARVIGAGVLEKPFRHKELLAIIEQLCRPAFSVSTENTWGF